MFFEINQLKENFLRTIQQNISKGSTRSNVAKCLIADFIIVILEKDNDLICLNLPLPHF